MCGVFGRTILWCCDCQESVQRLAGLKGTPLGGFARQTPGRVSLRPYGTRECWASIPKVALRFTLGYFHTLPTGGRGTLLLGVLRFWRWLGLRWRAGDAKAHEQEAEALAQRVEYAHCFLSCEGNAALRVSMSSGRRGLRQRSIVQGRHRLRGGRRRRCYA